MLIDLINPPFISQKPSANDSILSIVIYNNIDNFIWSPHFHRSDLCTLSDLCRYRCLQCLKNPLACIFIYFECSYLYQHQNPLQAILEAYPLSPPPTAQRCRRRRFCLCLCLCLCFCLVLSLSCLCLGFNQWFNQRFNRCFKQRKIKKDIFMPFLEWWKII